MKPKTAIAKFIEGMADAAKSIWDTTRELTQALLGFPANQAGPKKPSRRLTRAEVVKLTAYAEKRLKEMRLEDQAKKKGGA